MVNITLTVPEEIKKEMDEFPEMNWSAVAREAIIEKIKDLEFIKRFKAKSTFTKEDAIKLGRELNSSLAKRYRRAR